MIVKRSLSPARILAYVRRPMTWAAAWAVAVPLAFTLTGSPALVLPFPPIATLAGALAIFIAFRNNAAFGRWNEARVAWQSLLVTSRVLARQVTASSRNAVATGTADDETSRATREELALRLVAIAYSIADQVRPDPPSGGPQDARARAEWLSAQASQNPPVALLATQATRVKDAIRAGVLGQFDPISLEPQLVALNTAHGTLERLATTPTPRQYDYFTRRFVDVFAALVPFGLLSLLPTAPVWVTVLSLVLAGTFVVMAVVGAANDEPLAGLVTDVPLLAVCRQLERDVLETLEEEPLPPALVPVNGYLW